MQLIFHLHGDVRTCSALEDSLHLLDPFRRHGMHKICCGLVLLWRWHTAPDSWVLARANSAKACGAKLWRWALAYTICTISWT